MLRVDNSTVTDANIEFEGGGTFNLSYLSGVQFTPGSPEAIAFIEQLLNEDPANEKRVQLRDLPVDDPDADTDPATEAMFWDDPRGRPIDFLVSRSSIYTVTWDGERYQYSSRRARN